ncbi:MBL fold metallo-hydrolase [Elizabethkingia argentiflava]|uniref:MBL fold metallo-hydrolase n=1 Tax=Elizabethkingia argenteiflava TaxID=2681556 RepID=A0A845PQY8_9FLAO|nr:MBL fold metallo-hydrolase [Elizabethkingia argenteiflava]NAW50709.1 MBL fold metallo-hydrolase [Elizabethkingia argenteiflava]
MKIEQIYTGCLAQGAYYIVSDGEAAIIDPLREVQPYLERLSEDKASLKYIFETHFHADFVSGHLDLRHKTDAQIVYGPKAKPEFEAIIAKDGEIFNIGKIKIKVLHTPGHTLESSCFLLIDDEGIERALFSGDTLFLGDVGRPDLAQESTGFTNKDLAGMLYDSLMTKIIPLADHIIVYPAHGAGSACGKNMQKETQDSLGNQKKTNYALNQKNRASFIHAVTEGLKPPPGYFAMNVEMNRKGYEEFDKVLQKGSRPLSVEAFEQLAQSSEALILDTRSAETFHKFFIPQSINIGIKGEFAPWVGTMIVDVNQPILLVAEEGTEKEAITRLSRVGFDNVLGYLEGGVTGWQQSGRQIDTIHRISPQEFVQIYTEGARVIDVRKESEYEQGHVQNSCNKPLAYIHHWIKELNKEEHFFLHCAGGYRSMIAASLLQAGGYRNFTELAGGFNQIKTTGVPLSGISNKD